MIKKLLVSSLFSLVCSISLFAQQYKEDWNDLNRYPQADWLNELKFGMYWHWNISSVAGMAGWYGREMYNPKGKIFKLHKEKFGDQNIFGYKDLEKSFTAKKFSAKQWVSDAKRIGARFIVGMAVHHDGFDMYKSSYTPWNSVDKNPHIDVIGELAKEARKNDMKFGATSHLAWNWEFFSTYLYPDNYDAKSAPQLYNVHDPKKGPSKAFVQQWFNRTKELIDNYKLDFLWFDFGTKHEAFNKDYTKKLTAYYYNKSLEWGKTVALSTKYGFENRKSQVRDIEEGKFGHIRYPQWMSDCTFNQKWFNINKPEDPYKANGLYWTHQLIDIVSKNGTLLLNLGPNADGSWREDWKNELFRIGDWLNINGEAIYYSKPWHRYGEGPTHESFGYHHDTGHSLSPDDVRFTRKSDTLYAIVCGWHDSDFLIRSLGKNSLKGSKISSVQMLGCNEKILFNQTNDGLNIKFPDKKPCDIAYTFRIKGDNIFPDVDEYKDIQLHFANELKNVTDIKIILPGKSKSLNISELVVTSSRLKNEKKNITRRFDISTSPLTDNTTIEMMIDGEQNGNMNMNSVVQTIKTTDPFIALHSDDPHFLENILIFTEMNSYDEIYNSAIIQVKDNSGRIILNGKLKDLSSFK